MRRCAEPWLPAQILDRPKMGFMFPLGSWMRGPLRPAMRSLLGDSQLVGAGIVRREPIDALLEEHERSAADHHMRLWILLNLEVWHRLYFGGESIEQVESRIADHAELAVRSLATGSGRS
jgi:asparagine synthase (glutamine-hydrolysing)